MAELYESLQELVAVFVQAEDPTLPFGRCVPQGWPEIRDLLGPAFWLGIPGRGLALVRDSGPPCAIVAPQLLGGGGGKLRRILGSHRR